MASICLGACNEAADPVATVTTERTRVAFSVESTRAVMVHLPPEPRPWDTSAEALEEAVARGHGHAMMAFKEPSSERLVAQIGSSRGRRAAVSAETIRAGLELVERLGGEIVRPNRLIGGAHVALPPGVAAALREQAIVDFIEPSHAVVRMAASRPSISRLGEESEVIPIGIEMVKVNWNVSEGADVKIGFIDDGYDTTHVDVNHNLPSSQCRKVSGYTLVEGCYTGGWHGTFVGGVMTARHNGIGIKGLVKGLDYDDLHFCQVGDGDSANVIVADCIDWMDSQGVRIINMSFGLSSTPTDVATAVATAYDYNDRLFIGAACNHWYGSGNPGVCYPAKYDEVIAVSGVMPDFGFANGSALCPQYGNDSTAVIWGNASNYGDEVELTAPFFTKSTALGDDYTYACGTSFAAPHVAGVAALLWSALPSISNDSVRTRLRNTATDLGSGGWDQYYGYGVVDATDALTPPPPPPEDTLSVSIVGPYEMPPSGAEECTWNASVSNAEGSVTYEWKWDGDVVSTQSYYVPNGPSSGWHWLTLTVWDDLFDAWDGRGVEVDSGHSCY
jgi:subtilisin family serine protease